MNTAIATQRIQTTCLLSLALLISLTSDHTHISEHPEVKQPGIFILASPDCTESHKASNEACNTLGEFETILPPPMRLVRPLSESPYLRPGDSIRYSF